MATSGVVGQSILDVVSIIEKAVRKCGVMPSTIGSEQLVNARDSLALILIALSNRGVNLWCVQKRVVAPLPLTARASLSTDTVNVLNALYRTGTYTAATSYGSGPGVDVNASARIDLGSAIALSSASITAPVTGSYTLRLERSTDNATWTTVESITFPDVTIGQLIGIDATDATPARYWRSSEMLLTGTFASVLFTTAARELPMSQMSRDEYTSLPNKGFSSNQPLQYFFDKQAVNPLLWVWPTLSSAGAQIVLWIHRQIQDVGDLTNTLDVPTRWVNAIIFRLASQICLELPKELVDPGRYQVLVGLAEEHTRSAEDGETDGAPLRFQVNIGVYTR